MTLFPRSHSIRNRKVCDFSLPRYAQRQQHSGLLSQDFLGRFADRDRISVKIHWRGCGGALILWRSRNGSLKGLLGSALDKIALNSSS